MCAAGSDLEIAPLLFDAEVKGRVSLAAELLHSLLTVI
jgi:hypothetical protein